LRLYRFENKSISAEIDIGDFFEESLLHYLRESSMDVPASLQSGKAPAITRGAHGKPYFCEPGLERVFFSLSHTRGYAIICFSDGEIGADCENTRARAGMGARCERIAKRRFTDDERQWMASGDAEDETENGGGRIGRFFEIWTAKEAYMKYTGNGFSEGFRSFSTRCLPGVNMETGWFSDAPHIVYSVCTEAGGAV
jgi:phosphopantetheinyl transferase